MTTTRPIELADPCCSDSRGAQSGFLCQTSFATAGCLEDFYEYLAAGILKHHAKHKLNQHKNKSRLKRVGLCAELAALAAWHAGHLATLAGRLEAAIFGGIETGGAQGHGRRRSHSRWPLRQQSAAAVPRCVSSGAITPTDKVGADDSS